MGISRTPFTARLRGHVAHVGSIGITNPDEHPCRLPGSPRSKARRQPATSFNLGPPLRDRYRRVVQPACAWTRGAIDALSDPARRTTGDRAVLVSGHAAEWKR